MGLQHLKAHAAAAQASRGTFGTHGATVTKNPAAHPKGGARAGAKSGHKIVGVKQAGIVGKTHVLPSGGRKGAK